MLGRVAPFSCKTSSKIERYRFVQVDPATDIATYGDGESLTGISKGDSENEDDTSQYNSLVAVDSVDDVTQEFFLKLGADVTAGQGIISGTAGNIGLGVPVTVETPRVYAVTAGKTGEIIPVRSAKFYA